MMIPRLSPLLCLGLVVTPSLLLVAAETAEYEVSKDNQAQHVVTLDGVQDDSSDQAADPFYNETTAAQLEGGEEDYDHMWDELYFGLDLGVPQTLFPEFEEAQVERIKQARAYMEREVWGHEDDDENQERGTPQPVCENKKEECSYYAVAGECERTVQFMRTHCAPMCEMCEAYKAEVVPPEADPHCPFDRKTNALKPGDLYEMFEHIISNPEFQIFEPKVLSRPTLAPGDTVETANYTVGGPWMLLFDNITTAEEADRLVELGALEGYDRSLDVTEQNPDGSFAPGVSPTRTSTNAWCIGACAQDPLAKSVVDRMAKITGTPQDYAENLQLLRYEEGQFYGVHHDYIPMQRDRPSGSRILTFYIYLNDVEQGGGTNFPHVDPLNPDFTILPKKGRAVLWPSVLNMAPETMDDRTLHQALPVEKGVKYGANAWIHLRDFKSNNNKGCV